MFKRKPSIKKLSKDTPSSDKSEQKGETIPDGSKSEIEVTDAPKSPTTNGATKAPEKKKKPGKITVDNKWFKVRRQDIRDPETGKVVNSKCEIVLKEHQLLYNLQSYQIPCVPEAFGSQKRKTRLEFVLMNLERMRKQENPIPPVVKLIEWLEEEYERFVPVAEKMIAENRISFDSVWYLFKKGQKCFGRMLDDQVVGGEIFNTNYFSSMLGDGFQVTAKTIKSNGQHYFIFHEKFSIGEFIGFQDISKLNAQPMNDTILTMLTERGKMFESVALEHHYMQYGGYIIYERPWGTNLFKADGRIMVDIKTFQRMNPEYGVFKDPHKVVDMGNDYNDWEYQQRGGIPQARGESTGNTKTIPPESLYQCWPTVAGFSFACKKWGEILVAKLDHVKFDLEAYDRLVLPPEKKALIRALVDQHQNHRKLFTDIISGKGGGRIFLLHGPPGVGKTLTAEAIAERLKDPLYSVTVGELGTNTKDLEAKLQEILEVASIWNAVILIDEADIFLEARSDNDIVRNAMVGIFLRLLEYHQGVLFLTTNRVKCFDEAFNSRISVALKYEELDKAAREKIWTNFLALADIPADEAPKLAERLSTYKLNGRQIRTAIQLSQALAQTEGVSIDHGHVERTLAISSQFDSDLGWEKFKLEDGNEKKDKSKDTM